MKTSDKNCKEEILELLRSTEREGIEDVISDLEAWGFFTAPASAAWTGPSLAQHMPGSACRV